MALLRLSVGFGRLGVQDPAWVPRFSAAVGPWDHLLPTAVGTRTIVPVNIRIWGQDIVALQMGLSAGNLLMLRSAQGGACSLLAEQEPRSP